MKITYLYIKQCTHCGLKYFGKTKQNPFTYDGSGKYWKYHFRKHGKQFLKTLEVYGFNDLKLCSSFALKFSQDNNIVESNLWANMKEENGLDGGHGKHTEETKLKMSKSQKGRPSKRKGTKSSEETKRKISLNHHDVSGSNNPMFGRNHSQRSKEKMAKGRVGIIPWNKGKNGSQTAWNKGISFPEFSCPYCHKIGRGYSNMSRWHFENCKLKPIFV